MTWFLILTAVIGLAYANGANDNFKGVATLFGSGTTNYRGALLWATVTTFLGSLTAVIFAEQLLQNFSGRGLVSAEIVVDPRYLAAVGFGAASTVLLATQWGMPISTTHGLVGALIGAGWAAGSEINLGQLQSGFFIPLIVSPLVAVAVVCVLYPAFKTARRRLGITEETCFCVGTELVDVVPVLSPAAALQRVEQLTATIGTTVSCQNRYRGQLFGVPAAAVLDWMHYLSAGIVSFARGLNDTPKIAALLLLSPHIGRFSSTALVGLFIGIGGLLSARGVAETMSTKITPMNHGQGFGANLITGVIVIGASRLGLPVSTTHVSCGALFGIGAMTRQAHWNVVLKILSAWVTTLPAGVLLGALGYWLLGRV